MSAKICKITIIMAIAALFLGCPGYNELNTHPQDSENGFLTINIGDSSENRTILPKNANINCNTFSLVLTKLGNRIERDWTGGAVSIELSPGSWDLTLTGYSDAQRQTPLVYGSANGIVVGQSQTTSHTVYLQPAMVFDRTGTFIWNINYPADVTSASMVITPLNTSNGSPQQTINFTGGALKNNSSSPLTLNTGYYKVTFSMTGGERPLGRVDYMHIYEGLESYFSFDFIYSLISAWAPGNKSAYNLNGVSFNMVFVSESVTFPTGVSDNGSAVISSPYFIGETPVTWEIWSTVRSWAVSNGYSMSEGRSGSSGSGSGKHPVTMISWYDSIVWCNALTEYYNLITGSSLEFVYVSSGTPIRSSSQTSEINGAIPVNEAGGFRLPMSNEWELAARWRNDDTNSVAGYSSPWFTKGDSASNAASNINNSTATGYVAFYSSNSSSTAEVKSKEPNSLGIYDMSGNVWEWCIDKSGSYRIARGGAWTDPGSYQRVGYVHIADPPTLKEHNHGLRIVRSSNFSTSPSSGKRYEVVNQSMNWENAKLEAERRGGYLAVITSAQEQSTIESLLNRDGIINNYWLGGYRDTNNTFIWITGEPMNYSNWYPGEPNNDSGYENRIELWRDFNWMWNDSSQSNYFGFIIEWD
ncbi:MAG: SUMF1/EgtB/PvdO family nonheme iron enzyme [Treponema sp.]|nr:SUMF1/EgtB/PvdO family nonheme iron enzyme [Treponema sp.]